MRAVIISAGTLDINFARGLIRNDDFIICADGGLASAGAMGMTPDFIVGDFDSFTGTPPQGENVLSLPCEKDYTDTHTAVLEAAERGADEILLLGASGTRLDHTLANIALLQAMRRLGIKGTLADANNTLFLADNFQVITGSVGDTVSLIPLTKVSGITLRGFKYPLNDAEIELFSPIWVSNELASERGEISFKSGILLVDIARD